MGIQQALWIGSAPPAGFVLDYDGLTFSTVDDRFLVQEAYNGGLDANGNPGPVNLGISHGAKFRAGKQRGVSFTTSTGNGPSYEAMCYILANGTVAERSISVPAGFVSPVNIGYWTAAANIDIWICAAINGGGSTLVSQTFAPTTLEALNDFSFFRPQLATLTFSGIAKSIRFEGIASHVIDSVIVGLANHVFPNIPVRWMVGGSGTLTFRRDGSYSPAGIANFLSRWCTNTSATIGDSFWIRATLLAGSVTGDTTGAWLQLNADRSWSGAVGARVQIEIATDAAGASIVASTRDLATPIGIYDPANAGQPNNHFQWT